MNLLHLEILTRLVQQGSFSRVAKDLGISQPTVTIRMKALEEELGVPLIVRAGNKVSITPAGKVFYEYAERSLRVLRDGLDGFSSPGGSSPIRFPIAGTPTVSTYFLPSLMGRFYRSHPEWEVSLHTGSTREVVEMILDEVAHVGFIGGKLDHPDVINLSIYKYAYCLIAPPYHPLAAQSNINIFDLRNESLLLCQSNSNLSYLLKNLFREFCIRINITMELNFSDTIKKMVQAGNGIAFLPSIVVDREVKAGKLKILPLTLPTLLEREISLIFPKNKLNTQPLIDFLYDVFLHLAEFNSSRYTGDHITDISIIK